MKMKLTLTVILSLITAAPQLIAMQYGYYKILDAIHKNDIKLVKKYLKEYHLKAAKKDLAGTPLHYAALKGCTEIVELLVNKGAKIDAITITGKTPLHIAIINNRTAIVEFLLNKGADINAQENHGKTPLHIALHLATENNYKQIKFLVNKDADINSKDNQGYTPLHYAALKCHTEIVTLFVNKGANINAKSKLNGKTPLHNAASENHKNVVEFLVSTGADINAKSKPNGQTPLESAEQKGNTEIVTLLQAAHEKQVELEKLLVQLTQEKDNDKIKIIIIEIGQLILNKQTPAHPKIKAIVELIRVWEKNRKLINQDTINTYIKTIPFNYDSLSLPALIEFAYYNNKIIDINKRNIKQALYVYPTSEAIAFIFDSEGKLYNMQVYKTNKEIFGEEHFITRMLNQAKILNKKELARNFFNRKIMVCIFNNAIEKRKNKNDIKIKKQVFISEILGKIISFTDGEFNFKEFNKKIDNNIKERQKTLELK